MAVQLKTGPIRSTSQVHRSDPGEEAARDLAVLVVVACIPARAVVALAAGSKPAVNPIGPVHTLEK